MKNKERIHIAEKMIEIGLTMIRRGADVLDDAEMEVDQRAAELVKSGLMIGDRVHAKYPNAWWGDGTIVNIDLRPAQKPLVVKTDDDEGSVGHFHFDQVEKFQDDAQLSLPKEKIVPTVGAFSAAKNMRHVEVDEVLAPGAKLVGPRHDCGHPRQAKPGRPPNDHDLLKETFNKLCDKDDWKAPIDALIPIGEFDADLFERAILYFTSTSPSFDQDNLGNVRVIADGYREGPAGP